MVWIDIVLREVDITHLPLMAPPEMMVLQLRKGKNLAGIADFRL